MAERWKERVVYVVAKNFVKEGCLDEFLTLARHLVEETNKNDAGCVSYGMYQDSQNPLVITTLEQWETQEDLDRHMKAPHFLETIPKLGALCQGPAEINIYSKLF